MSAAVATAAEVVAFWHEAGPALWFATDDAFDRRFRDRFLASYEAAARGDLGDWEHHPSGALALLILLDQFPRNAFRDAPRMYATDTLARAVADRAIRAGHDPAIAPDLRIFIYLPFQHSEALADQHRSVALSQTLSADVRAYAEQHFKVIERFGRFPHRNAVLGRPMRDDEQRYLDTEGPAG